ncbi:MAG: aminomethyl-transferring glycine dehydrogenase, partial [Geminicoccaceae bacterium]|nr:aminomethyl-transferring glycine dehydrogenase [Geminicoccaceae bacterium]
MAERMTLDELEGRDDFLRRHLGPGPRQIRTMLDAIGMGSLDELIERAMPSQIRSERPLDLPPPRTEAEMLETLREIAGQNRVLTSMIGMGYYDTITPPVIQRNVLENPGWYTAYTPYQAEVSQGRLEALINFQQVVSDFTGLELANASMLDEATAAAEAMAMTRRVSRVGGSTFFVDADCHPQTLAVLRTRARGFGFEIVVGDPFTGLEAVEPFGALLHYPGSSGEIRDFRPVVERLHAAGALAVVATDLLALALLTPPGEFGADIAVGSAQRFGVPMGYGGPHAAFLACRDAHKRVLPGRIIGVSVDRRGETALRMALQTREQHIRREKATSNICTAQVLLAVMAGFYAAWHGPDGIERIARRVHRLTAMVRDALAARGAEIVNEHFFDTLTVRVPGKADEILARALRAGINLRPIDRDHVGLALDETTRREDLERLLSCFGDGTVDLATLDREAAEGIPADLARQTPYLTHPVFSLYHGETEMTRYMRRLQEKDLALDRSMIPLGSCTMKLNAAAEMLPITWPGFAGIHPFAPRDQAEGYRALFDQLEGWLAEITGFDALSLQPNAGSQGEYTGLLVIRRYHEQRGEGHRDVCLIPSSAHGTNPASAIMAGLRVVVVGCDSRGNVDLDDLKAKAAEHAERLAALMITYPSTHGVFEETIKDICALIHEHGGQVYLDGANLNALVGLSRPGELGADVAHLNLHKTFCIPHGGGGPGMGPIGVKAHLAPYLPDHPVVAGVNPVAEEGTSVGAVAAAPWGSASILPISWAYIALMGARGLKRSSEIAILNANYMAKRLSPHFPVVYTGKGGLVAHECIVDIRAIKQSTGINVE